MFWRIFWRLGANFGISSFDLSNCKRVVGLEKGMRMESATLNVRLAYARLAWPILVRQARKPGFNSPTPLLVDDYLSIKETWE